MQVTLEFWCDCGCKMELHAGNFAMCVNSSCSKVLNLPAKHNWYSGQLTPEQVVALAEQVEMMHKEAAKSE
tara:strand:- start:6568 stop:6780 length:213 start_codon:yes stop_codon:yes gene_type:complete